MLARRGVANELDPFLDESLTRLIRRMRLAGNDELHGTLSIRQQAQQPLRVLQQQVRPLVGCKAACESDRQRIRVEHVFRAFDLGRGSAVSHQIARQALACVFDQPFACGGAELPQDRVAGVADALVGRIGVRLPAVAAAELRPQLICIRPVPGRRMNPVGDVTDGYLVLRPAGKQ